MNIKTTATTYIFPEHVGSGEVRDVQSLVLHGMFCGHYLSLHSYFRFFLSLYSYFPFYFGLEL